MDITNYIANLSMSMSTSQLQTSVSTSVLKKAMEANEASMANLIETMEVTQDMMVPNFEGSINLKV
ncbi:MAG: YjfB family protein [Erysipelotrichales bacterium]|nr:YjfB family protein [Erysipelotrichales bacterium]